MPDVELARFLLDAANQHDRVEPFLAEFDFASVSVRVTNPVTFSVEARV